MDEIEKKARELLADEYEKHGRSFTARTILSSPERVGEDFNRALRAIIAALRSAQVPEWRPIVEAPSGKLCVVGWLRADVEPHEEVEIDYLDDGCWAGHEAAVEHADAVAPPGSVKPTRDAPYQWFIELPSFPLAAAPSAEGVERG